MRRCGRPRGDNPTKCKAGRFQIWITGGGVSLAFMLVSKRPEEATVLIWGLVVWPLELCPSNRGALERGDCRESLQEIDADPARFFSVPFSLLYAYSTEIGALFVRNVPFF